MRAVSFLSCAAAATTSSSFHPPWRPISVPQSLPSNHVSASTCYNGNLEPAAGRFAASTERSQPQRRRALAAWKGYGNAPDPVFASRGGGTTGADVGLKKQPGIYRCITSFVNKRFFLLGAVVAVSLAYLNPAIGVTGGILRPELTVNKGGE